MVVNTIVWDVDRVWYPGISISYCAEGRDGSPRERLNQYMTEGLFSANDMLLWASVYGKGANPMESYGNAAAMLTAFLYSMKKEGSDSPILSKEDTIRTKQGLLKGMKISEIRRIAADVQEQYTQGLLDAIRGFRRDYSQAAFSDGLGPFILYHTGWNGMEFTGTIPATIKNPDKDLPRSISLTDFDQPAFLEGNFEHMILTGKTELYNKAEDMKRRFGHNLGQVAIIDDSGANVESMLVPVRDAGGIAVGFRPTDAHRPTFAKHGIPILKGEDLRAFLEVVRDPSELSYYAE